MVRRSKNEYRTPLVDPWPGRIRLAGVIAGAAVTLGVVVAIVWWVTHI